MLILNQLSQNKEAQLYPASFWKMNFFNDRCFSSKHKIAGIGLGDEMAAV